MATRLDLFLVSSHGVSSRERARALIMQGYCYVNNQKAEKPGIDIKPSDVIELRVPDLPFVSRGGQKLQKIFDEFFIDLSGQTVMDIGASTGGFTDCALQYGAKKVYAVDVGYGQLAWSLRNDKRVCNLERTNIRKLRKDAVLEPVDFFCIDVSFISLKHIFPLLRQFAAEHFSVVTLIKPQFEAGRGSVGKNGVVRDCNVQADVIGNVFDYARSAELFPYGLSFSPIKGPKGNIEYLLYLRDEPCIKAINIKEIVLLSHRQLNNKNTDIIRKDFSINEVVDEIADNI